MAVLPESMNKLDLNDVPGSLSRLENYINYMGERIEFSMTNVTRNVSDAGVSTVTVLLAITEVANNLSKVSSAVNSMAGDITSINTRINAMQGSIEKIQEDITALVARVDALEGNGG